MALSRHFLPWDRPLLPQAVEYLAGGWRGPGPLDLADLLVVVPTRQSGRRLREALAAHAEARQAAVFPPRVMLPESLLAAGAGAAGIATRLESHLAWIAEFRELELEEFRAVFPLDPPGRNFAWAQRLAQTFGRLQATLAEAGLRLADVTAQAGPNFPEAERWTQLARLEARHAERLAARGRREAQAAKLERARAPAPLAGIRRIDVREGQHRESVTVWLVNVIPSSLSAASRGIWSNSAQSRSSARTKTTFVMSSMNLFASILALLRLYTLSMMTPMNLS